MGEPTNYLTLTDAVIRNTTMPTGKAQHYLHDDKLPGLALRMRASGGRTWVYLFTKPGVKGKESEEAVGSNYSNIIPWRIVVVEASFSEVREAAV
jgi:hypothetical protein